MGDERSFFINLDLTNGIFNTPAQVTGLAASSINATAISLDWKKPLSNGKIIADYNIYHRIGESGIWTQYTDGTSTNTSTRSRWPR